LSSSRLACAEPVNRATEGNKEGRFLIAHSFSNRRFGNRRSLNACAVICLRPLIQQKRRDEIHTSSPQATTNVGKTFITWNRLHFAGSHVVAPTLRLSQPSLIGARECSCIKALDKLIGQSRARLTRERQCLFCNLFNRHCHAKRVAENPYLKPIFLSYQCPSRAYGSAARWPLEFSDGVSSESVRQQAGGALRG
jgi:hypothetical protein